MKLFKKPKSKFYWYDFTVRSRRYRGSTQGTKSVRALQIASLKLASVMETTDRDGWRLLKSASVAMLRIDEITGDCAAQLRFPGAVANANCALRTLRRMLHRAEQWKVIGHARKIKMMKVDHFDPQTGDLFWFLATMSRVSTGAFCSLEPA